MPHSYTLTVRDYEVDSYGGVNNATFLNYMEEGRKLYLATIGLDLRALFYKNIGFVVTRYEIDYLRSLVAGNEIEIETNMTRLSRLKFQFEQNIYLLPERVPVVKAINTGVPINVEKNRAEWSPELDELLGHFLVPAKA
ncbi:MAG: acyl-CoA thioesterase [Burkholderiales bacterium]|nr:acyl-CoA thioesterase [Burkholderiales bacterium]